MLVRIPSDCIVWPDALGTLEEISLIYHIKRSNGGNVTTGLFPVLLNPNKKKRAQDAKINDRAREQEEQ